MPVRKHVQLREESARQTGDDAFGLHLGQGLTPRDGGLLGYVFIHSPTLGEAVRNVSRYVGIMNQGAEVSVRTDGALTEWSYQLKDPRIRERRQDAECTCALALQLIRALTEPGWHPKEVHFEHGEPRDAAEHRRIFQCTVLFHQPTNALVFGRELLDRIVTAADPRLFHILEEYIKKSLKEMPPVDDFMLSARHQLAKALTQGEGSVGHVAKRLGVGSRTLQRRLGERGMSFRSLLDAVRQDLALRYLADSSVSVTEVAFLLGYRDTSAFIRAFRRWVGVSPLVHRRRVMESREPLARPMSMA
jgi:AraC-like DNA-binding protein